VLTRYVTPVLVLALLGSGGAIWGLMNRNTEVSARNLLLEKQIQTQQSNLKLLSSQLETEQRSRQAAEAALASLHKDVPDEDYQQTLPTTVQDLLDRFNHHVRDPDLRGLYPNFQNP
jgi:hypothetical protein